MKTHGILRALLVTTSFSAAVCGMDARNYAGTRDFDLMNPDRSFGKQLLTNMGTDVKEGMVKHTQELGVLASRAWNGDWAYMAGVGLHQLINCFNDQFLLDYNIKKNGDGEFNHQSFTPFLKAFRKKVTNLIHVWLNKDGTQYAENKNTGERYPIFTETPFDQLADFFIPTFIPMRSLLISICNISLINNYLGDKLDELAITCLLNQYKQETGNTLKEGIALTIVDALKSNTITTPQDIGTGHKGSQPLPELTAKIERDSPIVNYLQPRLNYLARQALHAVFVDIGKAISGTIIDQSEKAFLQNSNVTKRVTAGTVSIACLGTGTGGFLGGLAGSFAGGISASCMGAATGAGIGYKLANTLGGEASGLYGAAIGGVIGVPLGFTMGSLGGAAIGTLSGLTIGAVGGFTLSTFLPPLTAIMLNSVATTIKSEMNAQHQLLFDYYTYRLLPLTEEEHTLYYLNPEPTPEEKAIYHQDYARRDQLLSQTFAGEVIKQLIDLKKFKSLKSMFQILGAIDNQYESFMSYCFSSKDATVKEFWESSGLSADAPINEVKDEKSDKIWREYVLRTTGQIPLTSQDQTLKQNLGTFPSFKVKQKHLNQLSLYMNSGSAKDLKYFTENFHSIKESARAEEKRIQTIHETIEKAGERIAGIYRKAKGKVLSRDSIIIIEQSANTLWNTATSTQLDRLVETLERADFISKKFKENGEVVIDKDYLKNTLAQYIATRDADYLAQDVNQSRFKILKKSSLTESLETADIVDLLRKIDKVDAQNLPEKIRELLERGDHERDVVSEAKQNELRLIKDKYEALLSRQLTTHFTRAFRDNFKEIIKKLAAHILQNQVPLSDEELVQQIQSNLSEIESFKQFMEEVTNHASSTLFMEATFAQMNRQIVTIARGSSNKQTELQDEFVDLGSKEDLQPVPVTPEIKKLKLYDQYDVGGFNLIKIINETFKGNKLDALGDSDFEIIYEKIQEEKNVLLQYWKTWSF